MPQINEISWFMLAMKMLMMLILMTTTLNFFLLNNNKKYKNLKTMKELMYFT